MIVVIAVLAAVTTATFNGIRQRASETIVKDGLSKINRQLEVDKVTRGSYALELADAGINEQSGLRYEYTSDGSTYCATATKDMFSMFLLKGQPATTGMCSGHTGGGVGGGSENYIQTITNSNCPTNRTMAVDARDNHTYWVQKLADNKCWMLTNLAYAGGGTNTYSDVKTLTTTTTNTYTQPVFYIPPGANPTTSPVAPYAATDGLGQFGYLYNWCAAMGGQATAACANATTPAPDPSISICPAGWRLPTGNTGGDYQLLNNAVNSGMASTNTGILTVWLGALGGAATNDDFIYNARNGYYRTSTQRTASTTYRFTMVDGEVSTTGYSDKFSGFAVRCLTS